MVKEFKWLNDDTIEVAVKEEPNFVYSNYETASSLACDIHMGASVVCVYLTGVSDVNDATYENSKLLGWGVLRSDGEVI